MGQGRKLERKGELNKWTEKRNKQTNKKKQLKTALERWR